MKPPPFEYACPKTLDDAIRLLGSSEGEAKVIAGGQIEIAGPSGMRKVGAEEFFFGPLSTVLESDEIVVGMRLPPWPQARRWAFEEISRRRGDFTIAGIALYFDQD